MKLPFCSVAAITMCLLFACNSIPDKLHEDAGSSADLAKDETTIQDLRLPKPTVQKKEDRASNFSGEYNLAATDTNNVLNNQLNPTIVNSGGPTNEDWEKKIIKTATVTLELKDYSTFNVTMHNKLKRYGAYIAGEQQTETETRIQNVLTIKVPVVFFEDLMNSINGSDIQLLEKTISTDDVTSEVVDTRARIEAKKQVRDKYMELLKQAKTMKDILAVQEEINSIQEDLEAASGRVAYLSHSAAYSTIHLTYYQYLHGNSTDTAEPAFLAKVKEAFATGSTIVTNILLFFISVWPVVLAGGLLLLYVKKGKLKKA